MFSHDVIQFVSDYRDWYTDLYMNYAYNFSVSSVAMNIKTVVCFRTKTLILDKSLGKKGREKLMLHFISVMKVHHSYHYSNLW